MKSAPRSIRSATISFGLVNIPVKVFSTGVTTAKVHFHQLDPKTKHRVRQQLVDESSGDVVERKNVEKGFEYAKGKYVVVTDEEIEKLEVAASRAMEISDFVPLTSIDPLYFDTAYYLGPDTDAARPYTLLVKALGDSQLCAVARIVMRGKEQLVVMRAVDGVLVMHQLRYENEVRPTADVPVPKATVSAEELKLAQQFISSMQKPKFDLGKFHDTYQEQLKSMLKQKVKGKDFEFEPAPVAEKPEHVDLMAALQASLGKAKKAPAAKKKAAPHRRARSASKPRARKGG